MGASKLKKLEFEQLIPEIKDWPISKFSEDRSNFAFELISSVMKSFEDKTSEDLLEILEKTIYLENKRVNNKPWKVDPSDDKIYWSKLRDSIKNKSEIENKDFHTHLIKKIVSRYTEEILGHFNPKTHKFARKFLYRFFNQIYNKSFVFVNSKGRKLREKLHLSGHVEEVRSLFDKGTVVLVPTHYSNLDSIYVGFLLDFIGGFPAFSYGAGLNLFDFEIPAYYMNRLGAYKIDRRKNNPVYKSVLLGMSSMSLQYGVNSLFFPGGGRSRSGSIETNLKQGLLSSLLDAQREMIQNKSNKKIIVVPVTFGYHFVLEAESLVEEYLKSEGRAKYIRSKKKKKSNHIPSFIRKLYTKESEAFMSFGKPMDVLGFQINEQGKSLDGNGDPIDLKGFFTEEGEVVSHKQRESIYTKKLAEKIVKSYHKNNVVLSSHLMAFIAFSMLSDLHKDKEIFSIVNLPVDEFRINKSDFISVTEHVIHQLKELDQRESLKLEPVFYNGVDAVIEKGLHHLGVYHHDKTFYFDNRDQVYKSDNFKLLYYYYNKMKNYELTIVNK